LKVAAWSEESSHDYYFNLPKQMTTLRQLQLTLSKRVGRKEASGEVRVSFSGYTTKDVDTYRSRCRTRRDALDCTCTNTQPSISKQRQAS